MLSEFKHVIIDFLRFLKSPAEDVLLSEAKGKKINIFIKLFLLEILLALIAAVSLHFFLNDLISHKKILTNFSLVHLSVAVGLGIIIVPFIEEVLFRWHLRLNERKIHLYLIILFAFLIYSSIILVKIKWIEFLIIEFLVITLVIYFLTRKVLNKYILFVWKNHYATVFFISAGLFGIIHITNYQPSAKVFLFMPVLVLPQLIMGIFCGYIRLYLGFNWGYALHALHNGIFILPAFIIYFSWPTDNYSIEIVEHEKLSNTSFSGDFHSKFDTIEIRNSSIREIIPNLMLREKSSFEFTDPEIADRVLNVKFARPPSEDFRKKRSSRSLVLSEIIRKYKLIIEPGVVAREFYRIDLIDSVKLNLTQLSVNDAETAKKSADYYGYDIIEMNGSLKNLASMIHIHYNEFLIDSSGSNKVYHFTFPKLEFDQLIKYMSGQYGISISKSTKKVNGYRVRTRPEML